MKNSRRSKVSAERAQLEQLRQQQPELWTRPAEPQEVAAALEQCHETFKGGVPEGLFEAIRVCFAREIVAPQWVVEAFHLATNRWYALDAATLDEAFDIPRISGHVSALRKRRALTLEVYVRVKSASDAGRGVGDDLFEEIGKELGLGKTLVGNYYAEAKKALENPVFTEILCVTWALSKLEAFPKRRK